MLLEDSTWASPVAFPRMLLLLAATLVHAQSSMSVSCSGATPGQGNLAYQAVCSVTGGTPPYTWTSNGLVPGLTLSAATGATVTISGTTGYDSLDPSEFYTVFVTDSSVPTPQQT